MLFKNFLTELNLRFHSMKKPKYFDKDIHNNLMWNYLIREDTNAQS